MSHKEVQPPIPQCQVDSSPVISDLLPSLPVLVASTLPPTIKMLQEASAHSGTHATRPESRKKQRLVLLHDDTITPDFSQEEKQQPFAAGISGLQEQQSHMLHDAPSKNSRRKKTQRKRKVFYHKDKKNNLHQHSSGQQQHQNKGQQNFEQTMDESKEAQSENEEHSVFSRLVENAGMRLLTSDVADPLLLGLEEQEPSTSKPKEAPKHSRKRKKKKHNTEPRQQKKRKPTKVCVHWFNRGWCLLGDKCGFLHEGPHRTHTEICKFYRSGVCRKGEDCPFSHDLSKEACKQILTNGFCKYGDRCHYSHDLAFAQRQSLPQQPTPLHQLPEDLQLQSQSLLVVKTEVKLPASPFFKQEIITSPSLEQPQNKPQPLLVVKPEVKQHPNSLPSLPQTEPPKPKPLKPPPLSSKIPIYSLPGRNVVQPQIVPSQKLEPPKPKPPKPQPLSSKTLFPLPTKKLTESLQIPEFKVPILTETRPRESASDELKKLL